MKKILFVCTGNTCRSAMAEAFFNNIIQSSDTLNNEFYAESAGIAAYNGIPASETAVNVMKNEWGISMSGHRSRFLDKDVIQDSFLVLAMTGNQKEHISECYPEQAKSTHLLLEYVYSPTKSNSVAASRTLKYNITDPYGLPQQVYSQSAEEIRKAILKLIEMLKEFC